MIRCESLISTLLLACREPSPSQIKTVNIAETNTPCSVVYGFVHPISGQAWIRYPQEVGLHSQGSVSCVTDPITDHFTPYCGELQDSAINEIRVLDECWRIIRELNTLSLRHYSHHSRNWHLLHSSCVNSGTYSSPFWLILRTIPYISDISSLTSARHFARVCFPCFL